MKVQPGGQPVDPVDEVHEVGHQGDPEDGQRVGEPAELDDPQHRQPDLLDPHPVADHGNQADRQDQRELDQRLEAPDVVPEADGGDQRDPDHDSLDRAVDIDKHQDGDEDPGDDGQPANPRDRPGVNAWPVAAGVHCTDLQRQADHDRRERQDDDEGDQEGPNDGALADEGLQ
jgi:hypothetical protein